MLPWNVHEYRSDSFLDISSVHFQMELFKTPGSIFSQLAEIILSPPQMTPCVYFTDAELSQIEAMFRKLESEQTVADTYRDAMLESIVAEILIHFDRRRKVCFDAERVVRVQDSHLYIVEYINNNYMNHVTLTDACRELSIPVSAAKQTLYNYLGMTFTEFLQKTRINNACSLLKNSSFSIGKIAEEVGYNSVDTFKKAFYREKHVCPSTYKKCSLYSEYFETVIRNMPDSKELGAWIRNKEGRITNNDLMHLYIRLYIYQHFSEDLTLSDIAQEFHFNETYLSKVLSENDSTFSDLLRDARVHHASVLLLTTDISAVNIGFIAGFNSTETFFRVFRTVNGMTPGEYRRKKQIPSDIEIPDGLNYSKYLESLLP